MNKRTCMPMNRHWFLLFGLVVTLALVWPGLFAGIVYVWFDFGLQWIPRSMFGLGVDPSFDWRILMHLLLIYWAIKALICAGAYWIAVRRFQGWCLGEE